jgi:hypothetical protein
VGAGNGVEVAQFVVGLIREPGLWHPRINGPATCHGSRESSGCPDCSGKPKQLRSKPACRTLLTLSSDWRSRISQFTKTVNTKKARHHKEAAKHHEAGKHETAAHHAHLARGHHEHAMHHAAAAAKAHIEDHGKAIAAQA